MSENLPTTKPRTWRSSLLCFVAFFVVFSGVCRVIREWLPFPPVPVVETKIAYLREHVNEYNVLFVGSSRMYYQILPEIFDAEMARHGLEVRSFNAGIAGMRPPEDGYYLDQILAMKPKNLKWVFVELAAMRMPVDADKIGTIRAVYWHDWERLALLWRRALVVKKKRKWRQHLEELREPFGHFFDHLELFVRYQTNLGRGTRFTESLLRPRPKLSFRAIGERRDGWIETGRGEELKEPWKSEYHKYLQERRQTPAVVDYADPVSQDALATIIRKIEATGARPVLVVPPTTSKRNFHPRPEVGKSYPVLDFSDINTYAVLFEDQYRLDTDHINTAGSKIFTKLLVERFLEVQRGAQ